MAKVRGKAPTESRAYGDGSYWYEPKSQRHFWRYQGHTVADRDQARAKAKLEALKERLVAGIAVTDARQTLKEYLERFVDSNDGKATTRHDYHKRADYFILPTLGQVTLAELDGNRALIKEWVAAMVAHINPNKRAWSLTSIKQALALLNRCLAEAEDDKLIKDNPAAGVRVPRQRKGDETKIIEDADANKALTPEEVHALLEEVKRTDRHMTALGRGARSVGMYVLYLLALRLGLRRGELCGLRWRDVDFERSEIRVRQQVVRMDNVTLITTPKTEKGRRELPADDLMVLLAEHKLRSGAGEYVFTGKHGGHLNPNTVSQHFRRAAQRIGLKDATFHDLRNTWITVLRRAGADIEVVADMAGHKTARVALDIYSDAQMDRKRDAMKKVGG